MFQSRTHTCNELRLENAGEQVRIVGWMENVREVGQNFAFVVVRDFYGTTQVVIETEDMMKVVKSLNKESTIAVEGTVRERASKNPKLPTGDIEVVPTKIEVLGRCRYNGEVKIVDVNIRRLRIKIEDDATEPEYITTVWGYGYKWGY